MRSISAAIIRPVRLLCGRVAPTLRRPWAKHGQLGRALALSVFAHVLVIAISGGGEHRGKTFDRRVESPPLQIEKIEYARAPQSTKRTVEQLLPPKMEFPRPQSELPPLPAIHIGEDAPGEGEKAAVATPLSEFPYYLLKDLSKEPRVQTFVNVDAPELARHPEGGYARLSLWINETGTVDQVTVDQTDIPEALLDYLRAAYMAARFSPGEKDNKKVRVQLKIEVDFKPLNLVNPETPMKKRK